jgi:hypothetical protein
MKASSMSASTANAIAELRSVFEAAPSKHAAHAECGDRLVRLAADPAFLHDVLAAALRDPGKVNSPSYPVLAFDVESNPYFEIVVHAWIPLPDGRTDLSTKAIHHHGELLLSTVTMFGPGYEHWRFTPPEPDPASGPGEHRYSLGLVETGQHALHDLVFVDAGTPHLPLFPPDLTLTVCLWSDQRPTTWRDRVKRIPLIQRHSGSLRKLVTRIGLADQLAVKNVSFFDFHPVGDGFEGLPEREEFERGPNDEYLQNLVYVLQRTGNADLLELLRSHFERGALESPDKARALLAACDRGEEIGPTLAESHYTQPQANFTRAQLEAALGAHSTTPG